MMNGVDYSQKLNEKGQKFRRKLDEANVAHANNLKNVTETQEKNLKNIQNNYKREVDNNRKEYEENLAYLEDKTAGVISSQKNEHKMAEKNMKDGHYDSLGRNKQDYDRRVFELSDSYNRAENIEKQQHSSIQAVTVKRLNEKNAADSNRHEKEIKNFIEMNDDRNRRYRNEMDDLRRKTQYGHQKTIEDIVKDENLRRLVDINKLKRQIDEVKNLNQQEQKQTESHHADVISDLKNHQKNNITTIAENFNFINEQNRKSRGDEIQKINTSQQNKIEEIERQNQKEKTNLRNQLSRVADVTGSGPKGESKLKEARMKRAHTDRIDSLHSEMKNVIDHINAQKEDDLKKHNDTLKQVTGKLMHNHEEKFKRFHDDITQKKLAMNNEKMMSAQSFRNELDDQKIINSGRVKSIRRDFAIQKKVDEQRHIQGLQNIIKQTDQSMKQLNKNFDQSFRKKMSEAEIEKKQVIDDLHFDYADRMSKLHESFQTKLADDEVRYRKNSDKFVSRIDDIKRNFQADEEYRLVMEREKKREDQAALKNLLSAKEVNFSKQYLKMQASNEKKMRDQVQHYERKFNHLRDTYTEELRNHKRESMVELSRLKRAHRDELTHTKGSYEVERQNIVLQFENRIEKLKGDYEHKLDLLSRGAY